MMSTLILKKKEILAEALYTVTTDFSHNYINRTCSYKNISQLDSDNYILSKDYKITISVVVITLILFTSFGNLITVVAVKVDRHLRSVSNLYIASLGTADLCVGSLVMTIMLIYTVLLEGRWILGPALCDMWTFIDYVSCTASLTNVCVIAADRFQTVSQPIKAIRKRTKNRALVLISIAWAIPACFWACMIAFLR